MNLADTIDGVVAFVSSLFSGHLGTEGNTIADADAVDVDAAAPPAPPIDRSLNSLASDFRAKLEGFLELAAAAGHPLYILETHRSAKRQAWLYGAGRPGYSFEGVNYGRAGDTVTSAQPGESKHEETPGRAADVWPKGVGFDPLGNAQAIAIFAQLEDARAASALKNLPRQHDFDHLEDA